MDKTKLVLVGHDPSMRNWGYAVGNFDIFSEELNIVDIGVIQTKPDKNKKVRQNSKDIQTSYELFKKAKEISQLGDYSFVEVPVGSQSARAMASYGICVGALGALQAEDIAFYQLTPNEVKLAGAGKNATKEEMITWAMGKYPHAPWPTYMKDKKSNISNAKAEHQADAVAAIHAGIQLPEFKAFVSALRHYV